ncbi:MAG TPA: MFS transporter [Solirubrobacteraceae bacterium]|nr:MFS transporter [Solirubrobacteraceae bacterium]
MPHAPLATAARRIRNRRTSAARVAPAQEPRTGRGWALLAASLGFAVVQLDVSVVNVAIKPIGAQFGSSLSGLQWIVSAYTVAFAALILSAGALGDRIGAKRVFMAGFGLFTLASAACGLAPSLGLLIAARAVQGVGAAVLVPCSLTLLNHAYPETHARARAIGLWAAGASVALSAGPLVGGVLTATVGWRAIFFINAPIGAAGIWLTARWAQETSRSAQRGLDLPGQGAAILWLLALTAAVIEGGAHGFGNSAVLGCFALAAIAGACFLAIEARGRRPMLPLALFSSPTFSAATAIGLLINIAFYGLIFLLSLFFQRVQHHDPLVTGLAFAPMTAIVMASNLLAARLARAFGAGRTILAGAVVMSAGLAALLGVAASSPYVALVGQLVAIGAGIGLIVPAMTAALLGSVERSRSGVASGTLNTARQTGSVIGVALFGSLAAGGLLGGLRDALLVSIALALGAGALGVLIDLREGRA